MSFYKSVQCFRRYELAIAKALRDYPTPVRFKTARSVNTDQARCADAITNYRKQRWPTTDPIFATFEDRPLKVRVVGGHVEIGPPVKEELEDVLQGSSAATHDMQSIKMMPSSEEHLRAIIYLVDQGCFADPVMIPSEFKQQVEVMIHGLMNIAPVYTDDAVILF